jgi:hypothetical protein
MAVHGKDGLLRFVHAFDPFEDQDSGTLVELREAEDKVVMPFGAVGTHTGEFAGVAATKAAVAVPMVACRGSVPIGWSPTICTTTPPP